jgi:23S rRNA pseudouridine2605 synthase
VPDQRLQKIIAAAGVTSRRKAEGLIVDGRVAVNGEIRRELGTTADPDSDLVTLDGRPLKLERLRYFLANKPGGMLCAVRDDRGRPVVIGLLPESVRERLYPAGRLDLDSEGLVLLTNDGELMQQVTRPGGGIEKVYEVTVGGRPSADELARLRRGPEIEGRKLMPCTIDELERVEPQQRGAGENQRGFTRLRVVLREGKKNQIRRMFGDAGHRVDRLVRHAIGPLTLERVPEGGTRELAAEEVEALRSSAGATP